MEVTSESGVVSDGFSDVILDFVNKEYGEVFTNCILALYLP